MRLRELARASAMLLLVPDADPDTARRAADAVAAPVRTYGLDELDPTGELVAALGARPGEVWVIRPDAHVAAVLTRPDVEALTVALGRALGDDRRPSHVGAPAGAARRDPQRSSPVERPRGGV